MTLREEDNSAQSSKSSGLSPAWVAELDRRTAEYEAGLVELIDNDEVFASVRAQLHDWPPNPEPTSE